MLPLLVTVAVTMPVSTVTVCCWLAAADAPPVTVRYASTATSRIASSSTPFTSQVRLGRRSRATNDTTQAPHGRWVRQTSLIEPSRAMASPCRICENAEESSARPQATPTGRPVWPCRLCRLGAAAVHPPHRRNTALSRGLDLESARAHRVSGVIPESLDHFWHTRRVAIVASTRRDGTVHQVPVRCMRDGSRFLVLTESRSVKARNVARTGRVVRAPRPDDFWSRRRGCEQPQLGSRAGQTPAAGREQDHVTRSVRHVAPSGDQGRRSSVTCRGSAKRDVDVGTSRGRRPMFTCSSQVIHDVD